MDGPASVRQALKEAQSPGLQSLTRGRVGDTTRARRSQSSSPSVSARVRPADMPVDPSRASSPSTSPTRAGWIAHRQVSWADRGTNLRDGRSRPSGALVRCRPRWREWMAARIWSVRGEVGERRRSRWRGDPTSVAVVSTPSIARRARRRPFVPNLEASPTSTPISWRPLCSVFSRGPAGYHCSVGDRAFRPSHQHRRRCSCRHQDAVAVRHDLGPSGVCAGGRALVNCRVADACSRR